MEYGNKAVLVGEQYFNIICISNNKSETQIVYDEISAKL